MPKPLTICVYAIEFCIVEKNLNGFRITVLSLKQRMTLPDIMHSTNE